MVINVMPPDRSAKLLEILWGITKRKKMEEDLLRSEEIAKTIVNATEDSLFLLDANGIVLLANDACSKKLNKSKDEVIGKSFFVLIPTEIAEKRWKYIDKVFKSGKPLRFQDEIAGIRFEHSIYPIPDIDGKIKTVTIYSRDITESYKNEQELINYQKQLRSLTSKLSTVEEQEKRRIARELHDRVGQNLALSKIKLEMLQKSTNPISQNSIDEIIEILNQTIQETRLLTSEISSPILFELGLESALEHLTEYMGHKYNFSYSFKDDGNPKPMSEDIRIAVYQAVRELLTNVIKHAQAKKVNVSMFRNNDQVYVNVDDDGVGFDVAVYKSCKPSERGFGLFSINERIEYLGGDFKIESSPEHGCCVTLIVPLADEKCNKMVLYEEN
jgi:PAS domain S-box-containing protein